MGCFPCCTEAPVSQIAGDICMGCMVGWVRGVAERGGGEGWGREGRTADLVMCHGSSLPPTMAMYWLSLVQCRTTHRRFSPPLCLVVKEGKNGSI